MKTIQPNDNPINYIPRRGESHSPESHSPYSHSSQSHLSQSDSPSITNECNINGKDLPQRMKSPSQTIGAIVRGFRSKNKKEKRNKFSIKAQELV